MKSAYPDLTVQKIGEPFFHSLSEVKSSSEMPSRTEVPGTPFRTLQEKPGTATLMGWSHREDAPCRY